MTIVMNLLKSLTFFWAVTLLSLSFSSAQPNSQVALINSVSSVKSTDSFLVALRITPPQGYHTYYTNPGFIGKTIEASWKETPQATINPLPVPTPKTFTSLNKINYGYSGSHLFLFEITPKTNLPLGEILNLELKARWQICSETTCIDEPGLGKFHRFRLKIPITEKTRFNTLSHRLLQTQKTNLPQNRPRWKLSVSESSESILLNLKTPSSLSAITSLYYYDKDRQIDAQQPQSFKALSSNHYQLQLRRNHGNTEFRIPAILAQERLQGILKAIFKNSPKSNPLQTSTSQSLLVDIPLNSSSKTAKQTLSFYSLTQAFLGLLIGGFILNLMPCVFPVIGLKVMSLVEQSQNPKGRIIHALSYTFGILLSFWILAGLLLGLRAALGEQALSWGYQLQNPWVVWSLILLFLVIALNLSGLFEFGGSIMGKGQHLTQKSGIAGSFFSGLLATVVSTPCSGPFIGVALAANLTLPTSLVLVGFTFMGLGLASPYLILCLYPKLLDKLPRPGQWMVTFKNLMAFPLYATVAFLLWIYWDQVNEDSTLVILFGLVSVIFAVWVYGQFGFSTHSKNRRLIWRSIALLFLLLGLLLTTPKLKNKQAIWEAWSAQKVQTALDNKQPVFVDFTARWCATCLINKKAYTTPIYQLFKAHNVLLLKADKTNPNSAIEAELKRLGREAVPVNALYLPNRSPLVTRELLSSAYLKQFIHKAFAPKSN